LNGKGNLLDYEFPIKILDNLIEVEEQMYGFSLFNRGLELKKSLIDTTKVKTFIEQYQTGGGDGATSRLSSRMAKTTSVMQAKVPR
jgi:hypothetical protein